MSFQFLDPGPLIDGELELVRPDVKWVDALLAACAHPASAKDSGASATTRPRVVDFLRVAPGGNEPGNDKLGRVPVYHFWMHLRQLPMDRPHPGRLPTWGYNPPPVTIAGGMGLRIGNNHDLETYLGHVGYNVYPPARGHHYAERSVRLALKLWRQHKLGRFWITCNPDNWASRRTCERLGCQLAEIVPLPSDHALYQRGERYKCRYFVDLND